MPHICVSKSAQHWFRYWLVAYSAPSHYLNQCWVIVNCTLRNKFQWNFNQNTKLFIHENACENIVCEMAAILSRGNELTCWGQVTHMRPWTGSSLVQVIYCRLFICRQFGSWTNDLLSIEPLGTNFSEILIAIQTFSLKKMYCKMPSAKCQPSCLGFIVSKPCV